MRTGLLTKRAPKTPNHCKSVVRYAYCAVKRGNSDEGKVLFGFRSNRILSWLFCLPILFFAAWPVKGQELGSFSVGQQLVLPLDISDLEGEIAIEIDTVDVTDFAAIVGDRLVVDLGPAIQEGGHMVTVYLFQGASYEIIAIYSFAVSASGAGSARLGLEASHDAEYRNVNGENEAQATSSGQATFESGDSQLTGHVGYIATTVEGQTVNGRHVDITEYALQFQKVLSGGGTITSILGHQTLSFDPILVNALNRRGFGLSLVDGNDRLQADLFAFSAQDLVGSDNLSGLSWDQERIFGGRIAFRPVRSDDLRVTLQAYNGEGTPFGALISGAGRGYSLGFEDSAREGRLRYGAHFGEARWDEDAGGPIPEIEAHATQAFLSYDLPRAPDALGQVTLGLTYDAVEFDFESLANPALAPGDQALAFTADYSGEKLFLSLVSELRETNYGGPDTLPTDRVRLIQMSGSYMLDPGKADSRSLSFGAFAETQNREITPPAAIAQQDYDDYGFNIGFDQSIGTSYYSVGYTYTRSDDHSAADLDEDRHRADFSLGNDLTDDLSVTASINSEFVDTTAGDWWTHDGSILLNYQTSGSWALSLELAATQTSNPFASDGSFAMLQASRPIGNGAEIVLFGSWGDGPYATESGGTEDAIFGVQLRASTSIFR